MSTVCIPQMCALTVVRIVFEGFHRASTAIRRSKRERNLSLQKKNNLLNLQTFNTLPCGTHDDYINSRIKNLYSFIPENAYQKDFDWEISDRFWGPPF